MNFVSAVAYHICLALPTAITQPLARFFSQALYVQICVKDEDEPTGQSLSAARKDLAAAIRDAGERTGFCYITSFDSILPASMLKVQIE